MEAVRSSETSVLTRATQHCIPENDILCSHFRENLKSYLFIQHKRISRKGRKSSLLNEARGKLDSQGMLENLTPSFASVSLLLNLTLSLNMFSEDLPAACSFINIIE
jgi:hypothetical protein